MMELTEEEKEERRVFVRSHFRDMKIREAEKAFEKILEQRHLQQRINREQVKNSWVRAALRYECEA